MRKNKYCYMWVIQGYYEHKFWEDWDIKTIQCAADNRYEEIGGVA